MYRVQLKQIDHVPSHMDIHKPDDLGSETDVEPKSRPCENLAGIVKTIQILYKLYTYCQHVLQFHVCMR